MILSCGCGAVAKLFVSVESLHPSYLLFFLFLLSSMMMMMMIVVVMIGMIAGMFRVPA